MPALPLRARLPIPLPTTVLRSPGGTLDSLDIRFRNREDSVMVMSVATDCSATYWCAIGEGALSYDGDDEEFPAEVPITPFEVSALETYGDIASEWDAAVKAGDGSALRALVERIEDMEVPVGLALTVSAERLP